MTARGGGTPRPCDRYRSTLLEADPDLLAAALRGRGGLGTHLRSCDGCRRSARRILDDTRALDRALGRLAAGPASASATEPPRRARGRFWPLVPLAAAAALAGVLLRGPWGEGSPGEGRIGEDATAAATPARGATGPPAADGAGLAVRAPEGSRVAVFRTADPSVTVVWQFREPPAAAPDRSTP